MSVERDAGPPGPRSDAGPDTGPGSLAWRLASLEALLGRACIAHTGVRAAGLENEIAVIDAPVTEVAALATLAREIRQLGFRFTTLDLAHTPNPSAPGPGEPVPGFADRGSGRDSGP
jgi:hypothetical protein